MDAETAEVTNNGRIKEKVPVREQDPKVRATNFEEVCLGYNQEEAQEEAPRCLNCKNAQCVKGLSLYPLTFLNLFQRVKRRQFKKTAANHPLSPVHCLQSADVYVPQGEPV